MKIRIQFLVAALAVFALTRVAAAEQTARFKGVGPAPHRIAVVLQVDRPSYTIGQNMLIRVAANMDGHVLLYYIDSNGHASVITPSRFSGNNRLTGGHWLYVIDNERTPLIQTGPAGQETIQAIVTRDPIDFNALQAYVRPNAAGTLDILEPASFVSRVEACLMSRINTLHRGIGAPAADPVACGLPPGVALSPPPATPPALMAPPPDEAAWQTPNASMGPSPFTAVGTATPVGHGPSAYWVYGLASVSYAVTNVATSIGTPPSTTAATPTSSPGVTPTSGTSTTDTSTVAVTPTISTQSTWKKVEVPRLHTLAVGAGGHMWAIQKGDFKVIQFVDGQWKEAGGTASAIAVDPNGVAWALSSTGEIRRRRGNDWERMPGAARSISIGANGAVWVIGTGGGDTGIYFWNGANWTEAGGRAESVAVAPDGKAWVITSVGDVYRRDGGSWTRMPGTARSIGIGTNGTVWMIGRPDSTGAAGQIHTWSGSNWTVVDSRSVYFGQFVAVPGDGKPLVVTADGDVYRLETPVANPPR